MPLGIRLAVLEPKVESAVQKKVFERGLFAQAVPFLCSGVRGLTLVLSRLVYESVKAKGNGKIS